MAVLAIGGLSISFRLQSMGEVDLARRNIFCYFYTNYEFYAFMALGILAIGILFLPKLGDLKCKICWIDRPFRWAVILTLISFITSLLGALFVYHQFPLCMDEFWVQAQANSFVNGQVKMPIPEELSAIANGVVPHMGLIGPGGSWFTSPYLPTYSMLLSLMEWMRAGYLLNPALSASTVILSYWVATLIWPQDKDTHIATAISTAFCCQIFAYGMSEYAMAAYAPLHLLWLGLYLKRHYWALPLLGIFIMGIHQPVAHALFIWPFVLRMLRQRQWGAWAWQVVIYLIGCWIWFMWMSYVRPEQAFDGTAGRIFNTLPRMLPFQLMAVFKLSTWSLIIGLPLFLLGLLHLRRMNKCQRDLVYGFLGVLLVYSFFVHSQGHGWGARYFYPNLPGFILVTVASWNLLKQQEGARIAWNLLLYSVLVAVLLQIPYRSWQVYDFLTPYRKAVDYLYEQPADYVLVDTTRVFYGLDLNRNIRISERRPVFVYKRFLSPEQIKELKRNGNVLELSFEDLKRFGLEEGSPPRSRRQEALWYNPRGSTPWLGPVRYDREEE